MEHLHGIARTSVEWMLYCLTEGVLLALFAWILLRVLPRQNAGTRFALWFSVLLGMIALPFLAGTFFRASARGVAAGGSAVSRSLITLPDSLALGIAAIWALVVLMGLLRVVAGLWQVNRIRQNSEEVDPGLLSGEVKAALQEFPRAVSLRISDSVRMPAAIGFLRPAVVIPRWFLKEISPAELEQVVLHELTHLRRRDDWTNLAQKIIKAFLFFHPLVWWVEQRISLEREMACDEAVLAQSASPHHYAQCLTRLAEKSLLRKKIALAQGMLGRVKQLSLRVTQILDVNRPSSTRIWKPAVPMVMAAAALCGFSAWSAPELVSFHDDATAQLTGDVNKEIRAAHPKLVLASATLRESSLQQPFSRAAKASRTVRASATTKRASNATSPRLARMFDPHASGKPFVSPEDEVLAAQEFLNAPPQCALQSSRVGDYGDYVAHEQVVITLASDPRTGQPQMWQVSMWQVRIVVPVVEQGKVVTRKKI